MGWEGYLGELLEIKRDHAGWGGALGKRWVTAPAGSWAGAPQCPFPTDSSYQEPISKPALALSIFLWGASPSSSLPTNLLSCPPRLPMWRCDPPSPPLSASPAGPPPVAYFPAVTGPPPLPQTQPPAFLPLTWLPLPRKAPFIPLKALAVEFSDSVSAVPASTGTSCSCD